MMNSTPRHPGDGLPGASVEGASPEVDGHTGPVATTSATVGEDLISFVASTSGESQLRIEEDLGEGFVRLRVSEAERRQAKHDIRCVEDVVIELLRNSRDAGAHHIYLATNREGTKRRIVVLDDGSGVPADMIERIFEPRVTSKLQTMHVDEWGVHGRGMALFSIRQNVDSARVIVSVPDGGTCIGVETDASRLSERDDQSTWPTLDDAGSKSRRGSVAHLQSLQSPSDDTTDAIGSRGSLRGPHNIARTVAEFALTCDDGIEVYAGSPAEVIATLRERSRSSDATPTEFIPPSSEEAGTTAPVCERLVGICGARELVRRSESLGLPISERTAHRIISGQISPLRTVMSRYVGDGGGVRRELPSSPNEDDILRELSRDRRGLRLSKEDERSFSRSLSETFSDLASRYYLQPVGEPHIRVHGDSVLVRFDFTKTD